MIESGEPLTSFLGNRPESVRDDLARWVREGRIQIGALHSTVNAEQISHETLARLFYLSARHGADLLGTPTGRTAMLDDGIGITWPSATFCADAGTPYSFHGHNNCGNCEELEKSRLSFWEGPGRDLQQGVLTYSAQYGADCPATIKIPLNDN